MPIGHRFEWFSTKSRWEQNDPPPNATCTYCGQRYDQIESMHYCRVMMERARGQNEPAWDEPVKTSETDAE